MHPESATAFPSAVVWDLDGTLLDSLPDLYGVLNTILADNGHRSLPLEMVRPMIGDGATVFLQRAFKAVGNPLNSTMIRDLMPRFLDLYGDLSASENRLFPGARATLRLLSRAGVRQAICTNKPELIARKILSQLSLSEFFGDVVGGDTLTVRKPDPKTLIHALDSLEAAKDECLMIGDSAVDVATARAVDVPVGIVTFGYSRKPPETLGADFLADDLAALPELIADFQSRRGRVRS